MKIRLKLIVSLASLVAGSLALAAPGDYVQTASKQILNVRIQNSSGGVTYYFTAVGGWAAPNCNNVLYAFINETDPGAKAILATALSAKATANPIVFSGICGDSGGDQQYLQIRYTTY